METAQSKRDKDYEDHVKRQINPGNPTLRGMGYALFNISRNAFVIFDDCQHATGKVVEAKGINYAGKLTGRAGNFMKDRFIEDIAKQATRQVEAAGSREIEWHFAEKEAADEVRIVFEEDPDLKKIKFIYDYWREGMP